LSSPVELWAVVTVTGVFATSSLLAPLTRLLNDGLSLSSGMTGVKVLRGLSGRFRLVMMLPSLPMRGACPWTKPRSSALETCGRQPCCQWTALGPGLKNCPLSGMRARRSGYPRKRGRRDLKDSGYIDSTALCFPAIGKTEGLRGF
jgi:hypothetical protein